MNLRFDLFWLCCDVTDQSADWFSPSTHPHGVEVTCRFGFQPSISLYFDVLIVSVAFFSLSEQ